MANSIIIIGLFLVALAFASISFAADPSALQDFCVADLKIPKVGLNGFTCKDAKDVTIDDFFFSGLHNAGNTTNPLGSRVTPVFAAQLPGLNTLGISVARLDYAPWGLNPPHTHPRASELLVVLQGTLEVGFITSFPDFKLFTKVLQKGDVFVFPVGLVHFQRNVGSTNAVALAGLSSQNPGAIPVAATLFGSTPSINDEVLAKAFQIDGNTLGKIRVNF